MICVRGLTDKEILELEKQFWFAGCPNPGPEDWTLDSVNFVRACFEAARVEQVQERQPYNYDLSNRRA